MNQLATRTEWLGLAVLALPTLLVSVDISVLYLALPNISEALHADATEQLWVLDIYSFLLAGFLVTMGNLGDRIGRRRLLMIGAAVFAVASVLAAFAPTVELLIAARALLGIAAATLAPSTMALIRNMFTDPKQMGTAIGVWFTCFMGGMLVGPLIGGVLLENFWWGSAFLIGVPVMVVLMIAGPLLLPEYRADEPGRIDLFSVALSLGAILPVTWGLKELARSGAEPLPFVAIALGLVLGVLFVRRQSRLSDPLLDLALFRNRIFSTSIVMMLLGGVVMAGISLVSAIYLQSALGLSPLAAGLLLIPQNVAMVIGFQVAPLLARRFPVPVVIAVGLGIGAVGFLLQTGLHAVDGPGLLVAGVTLSSFGITFPMALLTTLMLAATDPAKAGAASSVSETGGEFGIAVGIATLGSLATFVYRVQLESTNPDAPEQALRSLAGAIQIGGDELVGAARDAFTTGVSVVGVVGAVVFVAMAVVGLVVLRTPAARSADPDVAPKQTQGSA